jgi:hypothetical protein
MSGEVLYFPHNKENCQYMDKLLKVPFCCASLEIGSFIGRHCEDKKALIILATNDLMEDLIGCDCGGDDHGATSVSYWNGKKHVACFGENSDEEDFIHEFAHIELEHPRHFNYYKKNKFPLFYISLINELDAWIRSDQKSRGRIRPKKAWAGLSISQTADYYDLKWQDVFSYADDYLRDTYFELTQKEAIWIKDTLEEIYI